MTIERTDFDAIKEADLIELVDGQVPEGLRLDFKLTIYGQSNDNKEELCKDISAFANTHGGHLVIGIEEVEGVATGVAGVNDINPDDEILRMMQIIRNGLEPPVPGIRMLAVPIESGGHVILIRVPRSWHPPHRVCARRRNIFYIRHSAGVHEPSVEELRTMFAQSATALDQARAFRDERLQYIHEGRGETPLAASGRLILHIVSVAAFSGMVNLDMEVVYRKHNVFSPIGSVAGMTPRYNYYGFINERGGDQNLGYTQIFRNGILEATKASIVRVINNQRGISGIALERYIFEVFSSYIIGLRDIGVPTPLIVMFTLDDVFRSRYIVMPNEFDEPLLTFPESILKLPECVIEEYGTDVDHHQAVRPAFDALWNAIGYSKSQFFNEEGMWVGQRME